MLGLGLAFGPAIIVIGVVALWFRYGSPLKKLGLANGNGETLWKKIDEMENRQVALRTLLPQEYAQKDSLMSIDARLLGIEQKLDNFIRDYHSHIGAADRAFKGA